MGGNDAGRAPEAFEERWRRRFTGFAENSEDDAGIAGWTPSGLQARIDNFRRLLESERCRGRWLDAGCGAGTYARDLAARGCSVVGMDYSFPTIAKARTRGGTDIRWAVADVTSLPVRSGAFDGALCFGVVQALASSDRAVAELVRVVRPGGEVWLDALNGWCLPHAFERLVRRLKGRAPHVRYESPARLRRLARERGLRDVKFHWVLILPARFSAFQGFASASAVRWMLRVLPLLGALVSHALVIRGVVEERA